MPVGIESLKLQREWQNGLTVIYDGQCPFCSRYVELVRLRSVFGEIHLVNARETPTLAQSLLNAGLDLDKGMVAVAENQLYFGSEALAFLAKHSRARGKLDHLFFKLHNADRNAAKLYPVFRFARAAALWLLGRPKINHSISD